MRCALKRRSESFPYSSEICEHLKIILFSWIAWKYTNKLHIDTKRMKQMYSYNLSTGSKSYTIINIRKLFVCLRRTVKEQHGLDRTMLLSTCPESQGIMKVYKTNFDTWKVSLNFLTMTQKRTRSFRLGCEYCANRHITSVQCPSLHAHSLYNRYYLVRQWRPYNRLFPLIHRLYICTCCICDCHI